MQAQKVSVLCEDHPFLSARSREVGLVRRPGESSLLDGDDLDASAFRAFRHGPGPMLVQESCPHLPVVVR